MVDPLLYRSLVSIISLIHLLLFSDQIMSNSLQHHEQQHASLPCPPLPPRVCSNSHPLSQWCYLTISPSAALFSFCLQSFPTSGSFPVSWLFTLHDQRIGAFASTHLFNAVIIIHLMFLREKTVSLFKWQPTPVSLLEESTGQKSLVGYSP